MELTHEVKSAGSSVCRISQHGCSEAMGVSRSTTVRIGSQLPGPVDGSLRKKSGVLLPLPVLTLEMQFGASHFNFCLQVPGRLLQSPSPTFSPKRDFAGRNFSFELRHCSPQEMPERACTFQRPVGTGVPNRIY